MPILESLEFSNAMAALNCTAMGARGGIATEAAVRALMTNGARRSHEEIARAARTA
jgi:sulfofructose kinase